MANLTREQRAAREAEKAAATTVEDGLIPMTKDGEVLDVHPSCVADHQRIGWKILTA